ncbi:universal stress protein [Streptomyces sp. NPDC058297]|uniref:universal stress protein n=1 Tax=unclassified Streptomyces TaxID=2593676 RepID=UPI0036EE31A7
MPEEACLPGTSLHVVRSWDLPLYIARGLAADLAASARLLDEEAAAVTEVLRPWRQTFATARVTEDSRSGKAPDYLVEASRHASLVVVGRRGRRSVLGTHIGPVTHAVLPRPLSRWFPMSDHLGEVILVKTAPVWACVVALTESEN